MEITHSLYVGDSHYNSGVVLWDLYAVKLNSHQHRRMNEFRNILNLWLGYLVIGTLALFGFFNLVKWMVK